MPPPGTGLFTETFSVPPCVKSLAGTVASRSDELTYVVERAAPLIKTLEDALKLDPVTFSVSEALPGRALEGERRLSCGTGLFTVNVTAVEGRLPGFVTVTSGVPATAMALGGMAACNSVGL